MARSRTGAWRWTRVGGRRKSTRVGPRRALVLPQVPKPSPPKQTDRDRRPLTEEELQSRADFDAMEEQIEKGIISLLNGWREIKRKHIAELSSQVRQADNDPVKLAQIQATPRGEELLARVMRRVTREAGNNALKEASDQDLAVLEPDTSSVQAYLQRRAEAAAILLARSISDSATRQALRMSSPAVTPNSVALGTRTHLEGLSDAFLREHFNALLVASVNLARKTVMEAQRKARYFSSAVLDKNTCKRCREADGQEYKSLLEVESYFPFGGRIDCLGRLRCRCTIVAVY
jgi:hypothetical protein